MSKSDDSVLVVLVGSEDRPAGKEDIENIAEAFRKARKNKAHAIITHHALDFRFIPRSNLRSVVAIGNDKRHALASR